MATGNVAAVLKAAVEEARRGRGPEPTPVICSHCGQVAAFSWEWMDTPAENLTMVSFICPRCGQVGVT